MEDFFAVVRERAAEYRALTEAYDQELLKAHNSGHGTPEMVEHLRAANAMGADVMDALKRYQAAVVELVSRLNTRQD